MLECWPVQFRKPPAEAVCRLPREHLSRKQDAHAPEDYPRRQGSEHLNTNPPFLCRPIQSTQLPRGKSHREAKQAVEWCEQKKAILFKTCE
jgi:hypothetical protein